MISTAQNRIGGLLLIIGAILVVGTSLLTPGLALIDFVDAEDYIGLAQVVRENIALSFLTSMLGVLGLVLQLCGLSALRRVVMGEDATDTITRFGSLALGVGIVVSLVDRAAVYTAAHTLNYGIGAGTGPDQTQLLDFVAVILLKMQGGLSLVGFYAFLLGSIGLGMGLMSRIRATSYRVVAVLMMIFCLVSLVFLSVISPVYGLAGSLFAVFALAVMLGNAWLVMLGMGLYKGMPELTKTAGSV